MRTQSIDDLLDVIASPDAGPRVARYLAREVDRIIGVVNSAPETHDQAALVKPRVEALFGATEDMARLSAAAGYWAPATTTHLWSGALAALWPGSRSANVSNVWGLFGAYPPALVAYSLGLGATAARRYEMLAWLFGISLPDERNEWRPLPFRIHPYTIDERVGADLPPARSKLWPFSDHMHEAIRPFFREFLPRDEHFEREFDRFELLACLAGFHLASGRGEKPWIFVGRSLRLGRYDQAAARAILEDEGLRIQAGPQLLGLMGHDPLTIGESMDAFHAAVAKQLSQVISIR